MTWRMPNEREEAFGPTLDLLTNLARSASIPPLKTDVEAPAASPSIAAAVQATARTYPDHWWSPDFWNDLRLAGRYRSVLQNFELPSPPDEAETRNELDRLLELQASSDRHQRMPEILEEAAGPPAYYRRMLLLDDHRNVQTNALFARVIPWSRMFIMSFKHQWKRPRPMQIEPRLRPAVDCPHHASFPSGHSTQSHLVALLMGEITGREDVRSTLWAAADRIAENREYAGLHYHSDSVCGAALAQALFPIFCGENEVAIGRARTDEWGSF